MSVTVEPVMRISGLERWLGEGARRQHVLRGVSLDLKPSRVYSIVGPSGCGKSTLLYLLGLLDRPDGGEIWLGDQRVDSARDQERTRLRCAELGFVFQFHFLLSEFSARENVMLPMLKLGNVSRSEAHDRAGEILDQMGLSARSENRGNELSGGEQQRVAVARALSNRPKVILADEPTGNLDVSNSTSLFKLLCDVARVHGTTVLVVTHNMELASQCDECLRMQDGRFVE